jgi:exodeoxyribonuclease VII small subunit
VPKAKAKEEGDAEPGFDERLAQLEELVAELEGGELSLEDSLARYGRGVELLKACRGQLEAFRARVEELSEADEEA